MLHTFTESVRTGRAGREGGVAITLYAKEDLPYVKNIANVIAASEGQKPGEGEVTDRQRWLLESLPKLNKHDKKQLKTKGIASRRTKNFAVRGDAHVDRKTKISTKSGYEKRMEDRKKGARKPSRSKATHTESNDESDFEGFGA